MPRVAAVATAAEDIANDVKQAPSGAGAVSNGRPFFPAKSVRYCRSLLIFVITSAARDLLLLTSDP